MKRHRSGRRGGGSATVSIHVHDLAQLFNSLDPSPFWDRDLDREAAEFIEEEFIDKRSAEVWHLHVHAPEGAAKAADLQEAIEHYYERPAEALGYEWVPFLRKRRLYERLAGIRVSVCSEPASIAAKHVSPGA